MATLADIVQEKLYFLYTFFRFPKQIGTVPASSDSLAKAMTDAVPWHEVHSFALLGAGTGTITTFMQSAHTPPQHVLLFEKDDALRSLLLQRYPQFSVYEDACQLETALLRKGVEQLDCILCGLQLFNFPQTTRHRIIQQIVATLKPGGLFIALQYSIQMRKQLSQHFEQVSMQTIPSQVPPAFVLVFRKKETA